MRTAVLSRPAFRTPLGLVLVAMLVAALLSATGALATSTRADAATPGCKETSLYYKIGPRTPTRIAHVPSTGTNNYQTNCILKQTDSKVKNVATNALQKTLRLCYYQNITIDGLFGPNTKAALKNAQKSSGLTGSQVDGIYGPVTSRKLRWHTASGCVAISALERP